VRAVLQALPRARKVPTHTIMLACPYALFERIRLAVTAHQGEMLDEDFGVDVTLTARFAVEDLPAFQSVLREMSNGRIEAEVVETNEATILPLTPSDESWQAGEE
jgi:putative IMPACT (imprinted ancient) family translation regulator